MTLSAIKSMFIPGAYWRCDRTTPLANQKGIFRRVARLAGAELLWDIGHPSPLYTTWPKASEIVEASDGKLVFQYEHMKETITFLRLSGTDAEDAATYLEDWRKSAEEMLAAETLHKEKESARLQAEARRNREDKIRKGLPIDSASLLDALQENGFQLAPGTIGAIRRKIREVTPQGWNYVARGKPRFSYDTQPAVLYLKIQDHLLLQDLGADEPEIATLPEVSALDAFAA